MGGADVGNDDWVEQFELTQGRKRWSHDRLLYNSVVNVPDVTLRCRLRDRKVQQVQVNHYTSGRIIYLDVVRVKDGAFSIPLKLFRGFNEITLTSFDALQRRHSRYVVCKTTCREWIETAVFSLILALVIRTFFVQAFIIPSSSMERTLCKGDRILVNKLAYRLFPPRRKDVVVFEYPKDHSECFIKRIVGLGGESLSICDERVSVGGILVDEPYVYDPVRSPAFPDEDRDVSRFEVPRGKYFLMGDNRRVSWDSRKYGAVGPEGFLGRASFIYWPSARMGWIR